MDLESEIKRLLLLLLLLMDIKVLYKMDFINTKIKDLCYS